MITRRELIGLGMTMPLWSATAPEFWNTKPPSEWTPAEVDEMLTRSPWAKAASVDFKGGFGGAVGPRMTRYGGVVEGPETPTAGRPVSGPKRGFLAVVRWDSSLPIREALKVRASSATEKYYVLSVTGDLPMIGRRADDDPAAEDRTVEMLKQYSRLERKGEPIYLDDALTSPPDYPGGPATLFYFSRGDSILPGDKQVTFVTKFGPYELKAHFTLKEMLYRGKLEL